jgi:uncharacterized membrane protein
MLKKRFSKEEAVNFGWKTTLDNLGFFIKVLIIVFIIIGTFGVIGRLTEEKLPFISLAATFIEVILNIIFGIGLIKIYLKFCDNEVAPLGDLFSGRNLKLFFSYLLVSIVYTLIIIMGLILIIVPGIIWGIQFQFCTFLVVDKGMNPFEALKKSSSITKGAKWDLFIFGLLMLLINLVGILALFIGLFVTIPITMLALTFVYRKLLAQSETAQTATAP